VVDGKLHIRTFLSDKLEELGFIAHHCARAVDMRTALANYEPDLVVLGLLKPESDVTNTLNVMALTGFAGKVMLFGGRASTALLALHDLGEQLGLGMLPPLRTPFRDSDLNENLSPLLPIAAAPSLDVDVDEALRNGWLELWYQPKINLREMTVAGAEALVRMRHPNWGIVSPASFVPGENDPGLVSLSEFVVERAMADWNAMAHGRNPLEMTVHLPVAVLEDPEFIDRMCLQIPDHAAFTKLIVEINSVDLGRNHELVRKAAKQLQTYNVGISIDDVMAESSWVDVVDFPIAELQVEGSFINGCADDRNKRMACEMVVDIAERLKARTTAKGIEQTLDCRAVCKMGFDFGQGFLFAKPMEMHRFARTMLRQHSAKR
jgi:EAL domain-containing protein (putative c-di-GMP-specific phosphodiesterase class I)